tara:strand:- start:163 stop:348 length:186 start_codon:yes stop_codon:yes gene_type:complete
MNRRIDEERLKSAIRTLWSDVGYIPAMNVYKLLDNPLLDYYYVKEICENLLKELESTDKNE